LGANRILIASTNEEAIRWVGVHCLRRCKAFPITGRRRDAVSAGAILAIAIAAMLSGANDLIAIFRWGRRLSPKALQALGVDKKRKRAPCHATYHYVFKSLSAAELTKALGCLVPSEGGLGHVVAIDGKRLRGSQCETSPGVHMLQAFSTKLRAAIGSLRQWRRQELRAKPHAFPASRFLQARCRAPTDKTGFVEKVGVVPDQPLRKRLGL
jgi:hypothetical protein